jgi:ArsR family transcriptional regulator
VGSEWQSIRRELFGFGFTEEALLGLLPTDWVVADLGCGSGDAAERLAPVVSRVLAVDREPAMLEAAQQRLSTHSNVEFVEAQLDQLPLGDGAIDAAVMMLVLHHQKNPQANVDEVARVLKDGGYLVIVDMVAHDRLDLVEAMQHHHLGFEETTISGWAERSGLQIRSTRRLHASLNGRGPALFACIMQKPSLNS